MLADAKADGREASAAARAVDVGVGVGAADLEDEVGGKARPKRRAASMHTASDEPAAKKPQPAAGSAHHPSAAPAPKATPAYVRACVVGVDVLAQGLVCVCW